MIAGTETDSNERRNVNWLGVIALVAIAGAVILALKAARDGIGIDTAVIVALLGIAQQATSSIGTRRSRVEPSLPPSPIDPTQPPPYTGPLTGA